MWKGQPSPWLSWPFKIFMSYNLSLDFLWLLLQFSGDLYSYFDRLLEIAMWAHIPLFLIWDYFVVWPIIKNNLIGKLVIVENIFTAICTIIVETLYIWEIKTLVNQFDLIESAGL